MVALSAILILCLAGLVNCGNVPSDCGQFGRCVYMIDATFKQLPTDEASMKDFCRQYALYKECIVAWTKSGCLSIQKVAAITEQNKPIERIVNKMCKDKSYSQQFLAQKECFKKISKPFDMCTVDFQTNIVARRKDENRFEAQCEVWNSFNKCVLDIHDKSCAKEAVKIINDIINDLRDGSVCQRRQQRMNPPPTFDSAAPADILRIINVVILSIVTFLISFCLL